LFFNNESELTMTWAFENERMHRALVETLAQLPHDALAVVRGRLTMATDDRQRAAKAGGCVDATAAVSYSGVLFVDSEALRDVHQPVVLGILAHELAHIALGHHAMSAKALSVEAADHAADQQVAQWGFICVASALAKMRTATPTGAVAFGNIQF
jgi:hypothetical protein